MSASLHVLIARVLTSIAGVHVTPPPRQASVISDECASSCLDRPHLPSLLACVLNPCSPASSPSITGVHANTPPRWEWSILPGPYSGPPRAWIGVDRSQGSWRTPEGQAISYSKWCPGQPDSSSTGYCGLIGSESSGCWDDYACGQSRPYLCQMDPFGPCTLCPADTYREGPSSSSDTGNCISCPLGSSSPAGSTSRSNCTCNADFTGPHGGPCSACPGGTYKNEPGSAACVGCAAGEYLIDRGNVEHFAG